MPTEAKPKKTGNDVKSIHKLKSKAQKRDVKGVDERNSGDKKSWLQPLQRHVNVNTSEIEFVTINVRVLSQVEHDFHARLPPSEKLFCSLVCSVIAEREHLNDEEAKLFSLWVISKDLELQIRPDQDIFALMAVWNNWVLKYTHYPEAEDPAHYINRHWFVFKREASIMIDAERKISSEYSLSMLYGEALRNYKTERYICNSREAAIIAGYQLQILSGPYRKEKTPPGFLSSSDILSQLVPYSLIETLKTEKWEELILSSYKQNQKLTALECRVGILDFFRNHPCYGGSFFPCCNQLPPSGFFELRTQLWFICIGPNGISVIDSDIHKYIAFIPWIGDGGQNYTKVESRVDVITIKYFKNNKQKEISLITPQSRVVENLATKILYLWAKERKILMPKHSSPRILSSVQEIPNQQTRSNSSGQAANANSDSRGKRHVSHVLLSSGKNLPRDQSESQYEEYYNANNQQASRNRSRSMLQ